MAYRYFNISSGLRGAYMPDEIFVARFTSRRDLKQLVSNMARDMRDAYDFGGSQKDVARFVAACWREARKPKPAYLPLCLPFGRERNARPFGIFVSVATRGEYQDYAHNESQY